MRLSDRFIELMQMEKEDVANIVTDLENALDEIENIIKKLINCGCLDLHDCIDELDEILQLIKQAKECA